MHCLTDTKNQSQIREPKTPSNTPNPYSCSCKFHQNKPFGSFSVTKKGAELRLKPSNPHNHTCSFATRDTNSFVSTKHSRNFTSPGIFKFVSATELVSFEDFNYPEEENPTEEASNDLISDISFEDEPKHSIVYPSIHSNRHSLIGSITDQALYSSIASPLDQKTSTLYTNSSSTPYRQGYEKNEDVDKRNKENYYFGRRKSNNVGFTGRIYCEKCKRNSFVNVCVRNRQESL
ncbi:hypothetical protein SteCoe_10274 [Stentor coeruleus]|uniref:Uncharacterized protein n=1 Tax=Stentor coeruleus TaxID=5963 RepID=A0A1R2CG17_9CILI|nr:hypothetical protein SteCoe_10274 [Stentor coeruleus]